MFIYSLKLLAVVGLIGVACGFILRPAFTGLLTQEQYKHAWITLLLATSAAFMASYAALFMIALAVIAIGSSMTIKGELPARLGLYALLLATMPSIRYALGGMEGINSLLELNHIRILTLAVLMVPAFQLFTTPRQPVAPTMRWLDLVVVGYEVLRLALVLNHTSTSQMVRMVTESFLDLLIPYYVLTRGLKSRTDLRLFLSYLMIGLVFAAAVAVVEFATQRLTYSGLQFIYDIRWQLTMELFRGSLLRVQAMAPQPLVLAFMLIMATGIWAHLKGKELRTWPVQLVFMLLLVGLVATGGRGPLLGILVGGLALLALRRVSATGFQSLIAVALLATIGLRLSGLDDQVTDAIASLFGGGESNTGSIDYRRDLLDTSLALISQSPWWGVPDYALHMQHLVQGEGIIDLVNSYLAVTLNAGLVGLAVYLAPFGIAEISLVKTLAPLEGGKRKVLGEFSPTMLATLLALMLTIFTTSTFGIMPSLLMIMVALPCVWHITAPKSAELPQLRPRQRAR